VVRRAVVAAVIGNGLEFFDFIIYGLFAVSIARTFFPSDDALSSLLGALATFGVGFCTRPIGAIVIGRYADRAGRKKALTLIIGLMTVSTAIITFTPGFARIGIAAPILVILARLLQGFSVGGEFGSATALLVEYAPPGRRGLYASWQNASQHCAFLLGTGSGALIARLLTPAEIAGWGWRLAFGIGLLIAPVGLYIRSKIDESPAFRAAEIRADMPLRELVSHHSGALTRAFALVIFGTVFMYILNINLPTYAMRQFGIPLGDAMAATAAASIVSLIIFPLAGALSDRIGRRRLIPYPVVAIAILVYPLFALLHAHPSVLLLAAISTLLQAIGALYLAVTPAYMAELFPVAIRSTGLSVAYNLAVMTFGGFGPYIVTWLIARTGDPLAPTFYVIAAALVTLTILFTVSVRSTGRRAVASLDEEAPQPFSHTATP
jgi:MHS family proline/betaine transporter-like MFS transporter